MTHYLLKMLKMLNFCMALWLKNATFAAAFSLCADWRGARVVEEARLESV